MLVEDFGLTGIAHQRVEGGGASGQLAVQAGVSLILAGVARRVAVVGFEASASMLDAAAVTKLYGYSFDAWTDGMTGVSATALYALSAKHSWLAPALHQMILQMLPCKIDPMHAAIRMHICHLSTAVVMFWPHHWSQIPIGVLIARHSVMALLQLSLHTRTQCPVRAVKLHVLLASQQPVIDCGWEIDRTRVFCRQDARCQTRLRHGGD